ncbi:MAG: hypothetical protein A4E28_00959 [Methanocella sp. PtaU1.Bin125]|nr:MAG: hypothetical protein A4E28_00959 [Methanocella sp. PtaU1.Bin125]
MEKKATEQKAVAKKAAEKTRCGLCGKEVSQNPCITKDGTCSVCGAKLAPAKP